MKALIDTSLRGVGKKFSRKLGSSNPVGRGLNNKLFRTDQHEYFTKNEEVYYSKNQFGSIHARTEILKNQLWRCFLDDNKMQVFLSRFRELQDSGVNKQEIEEGKIDQIESVLKSLATDEKNQDPDTEKWAQVLENYKILRDYNPVMGYAVSDSPLTRYLSPAEFLEKAKVISSDGKTKAFLSKISEDAPTIIEMHPAMMTPEAMLLNSADVYNKAGYNYLALEYNDGTADAAKCAYEHVDDVAEILEGNNLDINNSIVVGSCVGTTMAVRLVAKENKLGKPFGIVLVNAFARAGDLVADHVGRNLFEKTIISNLERRFNLAANITGESAKNTTKIFLNAADDEIVSSENTSKLKRKFRTTRSIEVEKFDQIRETKLEKSLPNFITVKKSGHDDIGINYILEACKKIAQLNDKQVGKDKLSVPEANKKNSAGVVVKTSEQLKRLFQRYQNGGGELYNSVVAFLKSDISWNNITDVLKDIILDFALQNYGERKPDVLIFDLLIIKASDSIWNFLAEDRFKEKRERIVGILQDIHNRFESENKEFANKLFELQSKFFNFGCGIIKDIYRVRELKLKKEDLSQANQEVYNDWLNKAKFLEEVLQRMLEGLNNTQDIEKKIRSHDNVLGCWEQLEKLAEKHQVKLEEIFSNEFCCEFRVKKKADLPVNQVKKIAESLQNPVNQTPQGSQDEQPVMASKEVQGAAPRDAAISPPKLRGAGDRVGGKINFFEALIKQQAEEVAKAAVIRKSA